MRNTYIISFSTKLMYGEWICKLLPMQVYNQLETCHVPKCYCMECIGFNLRGISLFLETWSTRFAICNEERYDWSRILWAHNCCYMPIPLSVRIGLHRDCNFHFSVEKSIIGGAVITLSCFLEAILPVRLRLWLGNFFHFVIANKPRWQIRSWKLRG